MKTTWGPAGVELECLPLAQPQSRATVWTGVSRYVGLGAAAATFLMLPLKTFFVIGNVVPPLFILAGGLGGALFRLVVHLRNENTLLRVRVRPDLIELEHRWLGAHVITETLALDRVGKVELEGDVLVIRRHDAKPIREPLPGLSHEEREQIVRLMNEAKAQSAAFWRHELDSMEHAQQAAALLEKVSPPR